MAYYNEYGGQDSNYGEYGNYDQQQPGGTKPPYVQGVRPMVDPEAGGEVDPTLYPEPKEATHKIRGKSDFIELLCGSVDQELLTVKTFYFFFYSAFGSLFPLMGVYFKQMGMNPTQCGLLVGSRPFVEFLSAPFWGSLADRWQKGKMLLLASLSAWIIFTLPLGFIQPPAASCLEKKNNSYLLRTPEVTRMLKRAATVDESDLEMPGILKQHIHKRSVVFVDGDSNEESQLPDFLKEETDGIRHEKMGKLDVKKRSSGMLQDDTNSINGKLFLLDNGEIKSMRRSIRSLRPILSAGQSPINVNYAENYNTEMHKSWVRPIWSSIVYRTEDIEKAFFLLLLLVVIGEFFSAPAITLADSAVITLLGEDADRYGHQRMFGSLGWGLLMFFVGIALDHSTAFPDHPCGPEKGEKNYTICFATFSVLMGAALITATQITFKYEYPADEPQQEKVVPPPTHEDQMQAQLATQLNLPSLADTTASINTQAAPPPEGKTKMFAQTMREIPEWMTVMKQFKNIKCASFLFVAWFMGFGIGLIFTFLFWHLQDYGGSPTLFGVASVINHISEIFAYFFSFRLIKQIGHVKVLCLGLAGNVIRFLYISWLHNPWWVLPFEFMQGITHAAVWAACCSYIAHNTPQQLRSSAQGVLQGLHHGLGRGCGAVIGGIFVNYFGSTATFRGYGFMCLLVLAAFIFINFYRKDEGFISDIPTTEDPHQVAEETAHLAPHGVPSNPIPRALSSTRLHDLANQDGYGATYQTSSGGNLDIPGAGGAPVNPFLQNGNQGGGSYRPSEPSYRTGNIGDSNVQQASSSNTALSDQCGMAAFSASTRLETLQPLTTAGGAQASYDW